MIVTSILILRKAKALTRLVIDFKKGNKKAILKHYSAFKMQTNVTTQIGTSDALNSACEYGDPPPYL